jgi:hypothetical protein
MHLAGQLGGAIRYEHVFFAAQLTVAEFIGRATLRSSGTDALGSYSIDGSGFIVYPGVGLLGEF